MYYSTLIGSHRDLVQTGFNKWKLSKCSIAKKMQHMPPKIQLQTNRKSYVGDQDRDIQQASYMNSHNALSSSTIIDDLNLPMKVISYFKSNISTSGHRPGG